MANRTRLLDIEVVYRLYAKHNSLGAVSTELAKNGVINPRTERPFTRMSILGALRKHPEYQKSVASHNKRVTQMLSKQDKLRASLHA